jgi:general secretion pathway protein F/type IV pilus assembly protein PilC
LPTFEYIAKDAAGTEQTGLIQAESEPAVMRVLGEKRLYPVRIAPHRAAGGRGRLGLGRAVTMRQLSAVYGQMSDLLRSGVPILRSLDILCRACTSGKLKEIMTDVKGGVSAGETLADALAKHPAVFTKLHVAMVRAGEHAGFLEDVLTNLATFLERQDELRSKVRGAMIYPVILAVVGVTAVTGILLFLVPKFRNFFTGDLPLPSRILFGLSDALTQYAPLALGMVFLVVLSLLAYLRSQRGRMLWAVWKLRIPLVGQAIRMVAITRFCRVFGTLLANGVPIIQALDISKDATGNDIIAGAIDQARENVRGGEPLAEPLRRSGFFPPEIIEIIAVGEESNQLEKVLVQVADTVERRTNRQVDLVVRMIEPLMLLFMAGGIGFIAFGLLQPIFTMAQRLK